MAINKPKGTEDLLGEDALTWVYVRDVAESVFTSYGFKYLEVPMFEQVDVFVHGLGTATDVVRKEMFSVYSPDGYAKISEGRADELKPDQRLALRPEATAGTVRAVVEHNLLEQGGAPVRLWYAGSMFRAERPQKGRLREFRQIGAECFGTADPAADAEVIIMFMRFIEQLQLPRESVRLLINSMGDDQCRPAYRESVAAYMREHKDELCEECQRRIETNPLRAFDCKNEACHKIMEDAPRITDALCDDCKAHYEQVKHYLDSQGIRYEEDPRLVRGLDYYTRTVFEVQVTDGLGAQNAIGGGGRYDKLVETIGGKPTPALGFASGFERIALALEAANAPLPVPAKPDVYVAVAGSEVSAASFDLVQKLRDNGFIVECDRQNRSLKSQFKLADKCEATTVLVLGPDELAQGVVTLRDMLTHDQKTIAFADVIQELEHVLGYDEDHDHECCCEDDDHECCCDHNEA
ncbi:MAG: histidine--tRNA ligase [Coriobacteriales bacterium]|nr:histidine--tRNA ligase [Coriobacteriales bacterium]